MEVGILHVLKARRNTQKLLSFAHHQDYEDSKITLDQLKDKINKKSFI